MYSSIYMKKLKGRVVTAVLIVGCDDRTRIGVLGHNRVQRHGDLERSIKIDAGDGLPKVTMQKI